eukprot:3179698-Rhodomonas_salina.1
MGDKNKIQKNRRNGHRWSSANAVAGVPSFVVWKVDSAGLSGRFIVWKVDCAGLSGRLIVSKAGCAGLLGGGFGGGGQLVGHACSRDA